MENQLILSRHWIVISLPLVEKMAITEYVEEIQPQRDSTLKNFELLQLPFVVVIRSSLALFIWFVEREDYSR